MRTTPPARPAFLHRYTSIQNVVQMLETKALTLRSPAHWEDRNDAYALDLYRRRIHARAVLAVCFTQASETYHHWKVFAAAGACVEFDRARLLRAFKGVPGIETGAVTYHEIRKLAQSAPKRQELPFLKRFPYRDENEFRIVHVAHDEALQERNFPFSLDSIRRITLSPWLSEKRLEDEKRAIKALPGCARLRVYRTTVLDNKDWKRALAASR